jgi:leader peptidase (prepilin peptidase)/N-methyltransferase
MDQRAWTEAIVEAFAYFGGVPARLIPGEVRRLRGLRPVRQRHRRLQHLPGAVDPQQARAELLRLLPLVRLAFEIFVVVGVGLAAIDIRRHRLPHVLTGLLGAASIALFSADAMISGSPVATARAAATGATVAAMFLGVALALPGQLGLGDTLFAGVLSTSLGWLNISSAVLGLIVALLIQVAVVFCRVLWIPDRRHILPFGPALLAGWMVGVVAGA